MTTKIFAVADTVPEGCDYITPGKRYEAIESPNFFRIMDDDGVAIACTWQRCPHMGGNWRRIEEPTVWSADKLDAVADAAMAEPDPACEWADAEGLLGGNPRMCGVLGYRAGYAARDEMIAELVEALRVLLDDARTSTPEHIVSQVEAALAKVRK